MLLSVATSGVALLLAFSGFLIYELDVDQKATVNKLVAVAKVIAENSTAALSFRDNSSAATTLLALAAEETIISGCIYETDGQRFASYRRDKVRPACPLRQRHQAGVSIDEGAIITTVPIVMEGQTLGSITVHSEKPALFQRLASYGNIVAVVLLVSGLVAFLMASWLQRFISAPILGLARTSRHVSMNKDYSVRASGGGKDEIGLLIRAFNDMLDQIQERDRELQAFNYSVSHDLRAPLRGMDGLSAVMLEDYGDSLDERAKDYLQRIRDAAQDMGALVSDMLKLSRVTRVEMRLDEVDLSKVANDIAGELQREAPERHVEFAIEEGVVGAGDATLLRAAISNLIGNAWKFTSRVERALIEFGTTSHDGQRAYFVRDNGTGFDMAHAGKLFQPFERLHKPDEFTGTGIGLATVHRIVSRHGGNVWCDARPGEGAVFYFTL